MSTFLLPAVPDFCSRYLTFQVPQIGHKTAKPALEPLTVQCAGIYALIDTCIVPEVPDFSTNRALSRESLEIIAIIFVFSRISKLLSIARKSRNFRYHIVSLTFGGTN